MTSTPATSRFLAVDPMTKGLAYAVLEGPEALIEWGTTQVGGQKFSTCLVRMELLLHRYQPDVVVLEDGAGKGSRRCRRVRLLLRSLDALAGRHGFTVRRLSRASVRRLFAREGGTTKRAIADTIARRFPELLSRLPRVRRPWMSEDERMSIFDAISFALTAFDQAARRGRAALKRAA